MTARIAFIDLPRLIEKVTMLLLFQDREIGGLKRLGNNSSQGKSRAVKRASVPRRIRIEYAGAFYHVMGAGSQEMRSKLSQKVRESQKWGLTFSACCPNRR